MSSHSNEFSRAFASVGLVGEEKWVLIQTSSHSNRFSFKRVLYSVFFNRLGKRREVGSYSNGFSRAFAPVGLVGEEKWVLIQTGSLEHLLQ